MAEKLAAKAKIFPTRPVLGTFLVMFAIINVSYFAYGAWFAVIKASQCGDLRRLPMALSGSQSV